MADDELFKDEPWIEPPVKADYGFNVIIGKNVFINSNCVMIDSLPITIGSRTLFGPNVSLFAGTHPVDPAVRNGMEGPEMGAPITIGEDCWIGGNVTILPGVTIGKGSTVGAGSVVTKVCFLPAELLLDFMFLFNCIWVSWMVITVGWLPLHYLSAWCSVC